MSTENANVPDGTDGTNETSGIRIDWQHILLAGVTAALTAILVALATDVVPALENTAPEVVDFIDALCDSLDRTGATFDNAILQDVEAVCDAVEKAS